MRDDERRLLAILRERSSLRGRFPLACGETSDHYLDVRRTAMHPEGAYLIGEVLYERIRDLDLDAIGGMQVGAVPLTTAVLISCHRHGRAIGGFWVRDAARDHGTRERIEGGLREGSRVAIVDDVLTTGGSTLKAIAAVRDFGCEVVAVLGIVDRRPGARERLRAAGLVDFRPIFTIQDFEETDK